MSIITLNGISFPDTAFANYGYLTPTTVNGTTYPMWQALWVAGLDDISNWAVQTGAVVDGTDYSAKEYAVGTTAPLGSAKSWATVTGAQVQNTDFSAKEYAVGSFLPSGSSKQWASLTGAQVQGVDFSAKEYAVGSFLPSGSSKQWANLTGAQVQGVDFSAKEYAIGTTVPAGSSKYWATQSGFSASAAAASASAAAGSAVATIVTYSGVVTIGTGTISITVSAGKVLATNQPICMFSDANHQMWGTVTSYNATTGALVLNITAVQGSGAPTSWTIAPAGAPGAPGGNTGNYLATTGGTANAITLTVTPALASYSAPLLISFIASAASTGPVTVSVSGLSAVPLVSAQGTPLFGGEIVAGALTPLTFDGTSFRIPSTVSADDAFFEFLLAS